mmetsp:Transcript_125896/g.341836  ORF Transcript_125896/g.341836 Transcript_125896/m.341836 type:complete len:201 (-) Transcript_125896:15-617(-)
MPDDTDCSQHYAGAGAGPCPRHGRASGHHGKEHHVPVPDRLQRWIQRSRPAAVGARLERRQEDLLLQDCAQGLPFRTAAALGPAALGCPPPAGHVRLRLRRGLSRVHALHPPGLVACEDRLLLPAGAQGMRGDDPRVGPRRPSAPRGLGAPARWRAVGLGAPQPRPRPSERGMHGARRRASRRALRTSRWRSTRPLVGVA